MRKLLLAIFVFASLVSCEDPVEGVGEDSTYLDEYFNTDDPNDNTPVFQVNKDDSTWTGVAFNFEKEEGKITINATRGEETLKLVVNANGAGNFPLLITDPDDLDNTFGAIFTNQNGIVYTSTSGNNYIVIDLLDTENNIINGEFELNLVNTENADDVIVWTNGKFKNVSQVTAE
ncbi:DUF6252 family protein [Aureivirga sp. CE67]|uniref:DUF6252 family protein n=1 Tax=Aureivirga sp. CE67 TaxID=1788983 RepID=UPI0018CA6C8C|nr:DUF6252 family protein [Aureivirga sp. CE67]